MPSPGYTEHEYGPDDPGFNIPMWRDPHLVISGPAGVIFVTPLAGFTTAGKTLSMTASADFDLAAQNALVATSRDGIELFTVGKLAQPDRPVDETGIRMAAASGPVTIQAQSDEARLAALQNVEIASTTADVNIAAGEHVLLTAQGAYLRLSGGNIEIHAPGNVVFHASQKVLMGPARQDYPMPIMPQTVCVECMLSAAAAGSPFAKRG